MGLIKGESYSIVGSPDKVTLFAAFMVREHLYFTVMVNGSRVTVSVIPTKLGYEDGSGESFILEGTNRAGSFSIYFRTDRPTGNLTIR